MEKGLSLFIFTDAVFFVGLQLTDGASFIRPARADPFRFLFVCRDK